MQLYYIYDCETGTWQESPAEWVKDDIEKIPVEPVFADSNQDDIDRLLTESKEHTLFAYSGNKSKKPYYQVRKYSKYAVARWRVQLFEKQQTAIIIADVYVLDEGVIIRRSYRQLSLRLDYGQWKYTAVPTDEVSVLYRGNSYSNKWDWVDDIGSYNYSYTAYPRLPENIGNRVMDFLKKLARAEFGFVPTVPKNIPVNRLLRYFVQFPLDVNVGWYVDLFGYDFKRKVHRNNDSNFELVCDYLNLPSAKSLKKAYHSNGRVLLLCYFLTRVGLRDVNAWQQFYSLTEIMGVDIGRLGLDKYGELYIKSGHRYDHVWWGDTWNHLLYNIERESFFEEWHLLVNWLSERWGTKRAGEIIYQVIVDMDPMVRDTLNKWKNNYMNEMLQENFVQAIHRYGFTRETHDIAFPPQPQPVNRVVQRTFDYEAHCRRMMSIEFELTKTELSRVEETKDGTFRIAHSGAELKEVGALFHNCVFSYTEMMNNKMCTIYYLVQQGKARACLEVRDKMIMQASGPCNRRLDKDATTAVLEWAVRHKLKLGTYCMRGH